MTTAIDAGSDRVRGYDPSVEALLALIRSQGFPGWRKLGVEGARAAIVGMGALAGPPEPVAKILDLTIPGEATAIPARLYIPSNTPLGVMVYLHGGGWAIGNPDTVDGPVRALANAANTAVLSVDYRLAPEHKYPAPFDDAYSAIVWAARPESLDRFGCDGTRLVVGGDSAGANLSAAACLRARDAGGPPIQLAVLAYPALDCDYSRTSFQEFGSEWGTLTREDVEWFQGLYVERLDQLHLPYVSPLRSENLSNLPRTFIITAEIDPLRDEQVAYAQRLRDSGVTVQQTIYPGMCHGFIQTAGFVPMAKTAIADAASAIRDALAPARG